MKYSMMVMLVTAALLSACGGGESPSPVAAPFGAQGLWSGTTSDNRTVSGIVLDNGHYWIIYSAMSQPALIAGGIQGNGSWKDGKFASSNAVDFNAEGYGVNAATVSASYTEKTSILGTLNYLNTVKTFSAIYNSFYETPLSLTSAAGNYSGSVLTPRGTGSGTFTVTRDGQFSGTGGGCTFSGKVIPHGQRSAFDMSITFAAGCLFSGTLAGVAYIDPATQRLHAAAPTADRTSGFLFAGVKG